MYNEQEIIKGCKKGKHKAQKILYQKYSAVMFAICMRYANSHSDAEDILQEGFVKIFSHIDSYKEQGSFISWMKRIFVNTSITYFHRNKKFRFHINIEETENIFPQESNTSNETLSTEDLMKIINKMPEGYRIVFNLYAIEGYKHKEIAELLNIDVNTSKSQYSRARKWIQQKLIDLDHELITRLI